MFTAHRVVFWFLLCRVSLHEIPPGEGRAGGAMHRCFNIQRAEEIDINQLRVQEEETLVAFPRLFGPTYEYQLLSRCSVMEEEAEADIYHEEHSTTLTDIVMSKTALTTLRRRLRAKVRYSTRAVAACRGLARARRRRVQAMRRLKSYNEMLEKLTKKQDAFNALKKRFRKLSTRFAASYVTLRRYIGDEVL